MLNTKGATADQKAAFEERLEVWSEQEPMNMKSLEIRGVIKIDPSLEQGAITGPDFKYVGQTKLMKSERRRLQNTQQKVYGVRVSEGFGKMVSLAGVYQGQFKEGIINGYGRLVYGDQALYEGFFVDGKFDGKGKYIFENGTAV